MRKDQGWVMKESHFCDFFPKDGISKTVIAFGVGSGGWGGCGATQEHRLGLPGTAASCTAGTSGGGFIYLHLDCHGICLPNIFPSL